MDDTIQVDLGVVTAYGEAIAGGYTGTREEFEDLLANIGGYYKPVVSQPNTNSMELSFEGSKQSMPEIQPVEITLPEGPQGPQGPAYTLTEEDKQTITMDVLQNAVPNGDEVSY